MKVEIMEKILKPGYTFEDILNGKARYMTVYTISSTENFINDLLENHGYNLIQLSEGCLGLGDCVLIAPDNQHYNFVIREYALTSWTSGQTIQRRKRITRDLQAEIEAAEAVMDESA